MCKSLLNEWILDKEGWSDEAANDIVNRTFTKPYEYGCNSKVLSAHCDMRCKYYKRKDYMIETTGMQQLERRYAQYVRTDFTGKSFDLNGIYRLGHEYAFYPGEMVILTGRTKLGKTAFMQNVILRLPEMRTVWFDLENGPMLFYRRLVQISKAMNKEAVINHYKADDNHQSSGMEHIELPVCEPTLDNICRVILELKPKIVVVDTVERVVVPGVIDEYTRLNEVLFRLRDVQLKSECILFLVHHIRKGGDKDKNGQLVRLELDSLKGNSTIVQQADKILAVEQSPMGEEIRYVSSLASRDAKDFEILARFDGDTFRFIQMSEAL
jgi:hypothetical protein